MVPSAQYDALGQFLEGLPQRYLQTRLPEQSATTFTWLSTSTRIPFSSI